MLQGEHGAYAGGKKAVISTQMFLMLVLNS
jgi:hypothetical protein